MPHPHPAHDENTIMQHMSAVKFAIIDANTLTCIGLQQLLGELLPMIEIIVYNSVQELQEKGDLHYAHFFVSSRIYFENVQFFRNRPEPTIILVNGDMSIADALTLNVCQNEKYLVRDIMALHRMGHSNGMNPTRQTKKETLLSPREIEVAVLLCKGLINKEVADKLNVSLSTIVTHRKNIMEKLHARSLADIIIHCLSNGIVDIEDL